MFGKMLNQNDQYEIAEGYFNDMRVMGPAKVWQPIDTKKLKDWDKVTNLTKTGKLTPDSNEGQGDAPVKLMYCDADGNMIKGPSQYILCVPVGTMPIPWATTRRPPAGPLKAGANCSARISRARSRWSTSRKSA